MGRALGFALAVLLGATTIAPPGGVAEAEAAPRRPRKKRKKRTPPPPPPEPVPEPAPEPAPPEPPPAPPAPAPDDGGDVVETIDPAGADTGGPRPIAPPPLLAPVAAPTSEERFQLRGFARLHGAIAYTREGFHPDRPDPLAVPHDVLTAGGQLFVHAGYSRGRAFEAVASGQLLYGVYEQDSRITEQFNGFNGFAARTSYEAILREAFVRVGKGAFDLRVGQQRIPWGRSDALVPNDVLNARDVRDPFLAELELTHLPTFAFRGDADLGFGSLQLVVQPFFVPNRFDTYGSNWSVVQPDAPAPYRGLVNLASRLTDRTLHDQIQPLIGQTKVPDRDFSSTAAGARFQWTAGGLDVSHYYHYGYDRVANLQIDPEYQEQIATVDFRTAGPAELAGILQPFIAGRPIEATYLRRHHVGLDLQTTAGPFTIRLDSAYDSRLVLLASTLEGAPRPLVQTVAGLEYSGGEPGKTILLEVGYARLLEPPPPEGLLFYELDTLALAGLFRWTLVGHFQIELRAVYTAAPQSYVIRPQLGWRIGDLWLRFGVLALDGEPRGYGRYFRRNNLGYAMVKLDF